MNESTMVICAIATSLVFTLGVMVGVVWASSTFRMLQLQTRREQDQLRTYIRHLEDQLK